MRRITLQDIAAHAGVSRATASMVVRGTGRLKQETRDRVQASMRELGYVYHRGAATLRTRRSGLLGLLVTDVSNPFFSAMTLGFEREAEQARYLTMLTNTFDDADRQWRLAQTMLEYPVDAFAYTPVVGHDLAASLGEFPVPALALTRRPEVDAPFLSPDDLAGGRLVAQHLLEIHGYRRLVYLGGPRGASAREDRLRGVRESIVAAGSDAELVGDWDGETSIQSGVELARRLLASGVEFDAVVCHSDVVAYAVLFELRSASRDLERIGVAGFDGLPGSAVHWPPVTSVAVTPNEVGARAADWLLRRLDGEEIDRTVLMTPRLEVRASCGCTPA